MAQKSKLSFYLISFYHNIVCKISSVCTRPDTESEILYNFFADIYVHFFDVRKIFRDIDDPSDADDMLGTRISHSVDLSLRFLLDQCNQF